MLLLLQDWNADSRIAKLYLTVKNQSILFSFTENIIWCETQKQFHDDVFRNNTSL